MFWLEFMGPIWSTGHDDCCHLSLITAVIIIIIINMASTYTDLSADLSLIDSSHKLRQEGLLLSFFFFQLRESLLLFAHCTSE